ncbi:hypothetical protein [Nonomuraea sp. NPDC049400]|uniref:hypothetical protein n=1 Tax=Nonomuraea sp. NPDC049400 TaxID=3364352 RepID=UPI0037B7AB8A
MTVKSAADVMLTAYRTALGEAAPERSDDLLVVVDGDGGPRWVVGPSGPGPVVAVGPDEPVTGLAASPGVLRLLNGGLPAVLVVEDGRLIGVLEPDGIRAELYEALEEDGDAIGTVLDGSDWELHGLPNPPTGLIQVTCAACGHAGVIEEYPPPDGLCPNGGDHLLVPGWAQ